MADFTPRSINEIYTDILAEKANFTSLTGLTTDVVDLPSLLAKLNSDSKASIWVLWAYVTAVNSWALENVMLSFIDEVEAAKQSASVGSVLWYVEQIKAFQYGDILQIDPITYKPFYPVIDTNKQIIGSCTGLEQESKLILKIRGKSSDILTNDEKIALDSYANKVKFVGTRLEIRNELPDKMKLYFDIIYDPQTPLNNIKNSVESTITNYINNLEFDSSFKTNEIIDLLQKVVGVVDPRWTLLSGKRFADVAFVDFTWSYDSYAGYSIIDPDFLLSDTITYIPKL